GTASLTKRTRLTHTSALHHMYFCRLGHVRTSSCNDIPRRIFTVNSLLYVFLYRIHFECRQKFPIRHGRYPILIARYSDKTFYIPIPGRNIPIAYRPVHRKAVPCRPFEIKVTPALYLPGPCQRRSTYLITPNPVKRLLLNIRLLLIFSKKMKGIFF